MTNQPTLKIFTSLALRFQDFQRLYQISGLVWNGRGEIEKVGVSANGGRSWKEAVLKSRAIDETGAVQPERVELLEQHGRHGYFHYNVIASWEVSEAGEIRHVYALSFCYA